MTCPYCAEPLNDGATVCKTCRRDVALVLSLTKANHDLEQRVQELEAQLPELHDGGSTEAAPPVVEPVALRSHIPDLLAIYLVLPSVLLIGAHYLLVIKFDVNLVWLRALSIALPAVFGWMLESKFHPRWFASLALGIVVAFVSVFGMSTMVHFVDGVPILPHNAVAWRETLEYVTSIALAYLLGSLIAFTAQSKGRRSTGTLAKLATFIAKQISNKAKGKSLDQRVERMVRLIKLAASASTAIGAVYTGFKGIL